MMRLTIQSLERSGLFSQKTLLYFQNNLGGAAAIDEILDNDNFEWDVDKLNWVLDTIRFYHNKEEQKKILEKVESKLLITKTKNYYHIYDVADSSYIFNSSKIKGSKSIFESTNIQDSFSVLQSQNVKNSSFIYDSTYISDSTIIKDSKNINNSKNILKCVALLDCNNMYLSNSCVDSNYSHHCSNSENLHLCVNCDNAANAILCMNLKGGESSFSGDYFIFNKSVTKRFFDICMSQFNEIFKDISLPLINIQDNKSSFIVEPTQNLNHFYYYKDLPKQFYEWAESLPNYNAQILYNITLNQEILKNL